MTFPEIRMRRLRTNPLLRAMIRETRLSIDQFIYPMFVHYGEKVKNEIPSMPGQYQLSIDNLMKEADRLVDLGVKSLILFGIPEEKHPDGRGAYDEHGIVQEALRALKKEGFPLLLVADVCLCEYTSHGHCGLVKEGEILNDETLPLLAKSAASLCEAGADIVAPSDMMDGRVEAIRDALDEAGYSATPIMSYAAKYASAYYGPFRDAAGSAPQFGDRRSHQMDCANRREAMKEIELDLDEGADIIMVKPAAAYLDVIHQARESIDEPIAAYAVSGEYSMIEAAAMNGWIDKRRVVYESLTAIKRAGADIILSYHAPWVAEMMQKGEWPPE